MMGVRTFKGTEGEHMDLRELFERQSEWLTPSEEAIDWRINQFLAMAPEDHKGFIAATKDFSIGMRELRRDYALPLWIRLNQSTSVTSARRPGHLLDLVMNTKGEDPIAVRQRLEALRKFDVCLALAEIERRDPNIQVYDDIRRFIMLLEEKMFVGSENIVVHSYHNPLTQFAVEETRVGEDNALSDREVLERGLFVRRHELPMRYLSDGSYALLLDRAKDPFFTWLKMYRQLHDSKRSADHRFDDVRDRRGLKLVFSNIDRLHRFVFDFMIEINLHGGKVRIRNSNLQRNGRKNFNNGNSSKNYRALDCEVEIWNCLFEVTCQLSLDFYSSELALTDLNHELYRQGQALEYFFPMLWPSEIVGINWLDPIIQESLRDWKSGNIWWSRGWRDPLSPKYSEPFFSVFSGITTSEFVAQRGNELFVQSTVAD